MELLLSQIKMIEAERDELLVKDQAAAPARMLMNLKGVGQEFRAVL